MSYSHRQQCEAFHLLFLERLLKLADPKLFVLKGGVNLRFFYGDPRYSEDMDLHVLWLGGHWDDAAQSLAGVDRVRAQENLLAFSYLEYESQVLDYLEPEARDRFEGKGQWDEISSTLFGLLEQGA